MLLYEALGGGGGGGLRDDLHLPLLEQAPILLVLRLLLVLQTRGRGRRALSGGIKYSPLCNVRLGCGIILVWKVHNVNR